MEDYKDKEVKRCCKEDKGKWVEDKLQEAELAASKGDSKTLFRIAKDLSGRPKNHMAPVKKANGTTTNTEAEQHARWKEHFEQVLNCPELEIKHDFSNDDVFQLDVISEPVTSAEIQKAIKNLKNGKSAGIDGIPAELLKAGGDVAVEHLRALCNMVWEAEKVPTVWKDSILIPLLKKGNLTECANWREIALLSIPGKVLTSIMLSRMRDAADTLLCEEQAGFRQHRLCCEQIFTLRQIIEKMEACNKPAYINFINFKKAFDCIHRDTLWDIVCCYGIPRKIINIMKSLYENSRCTVRVNGTLGYWFKVYSGVRQGCLLSPLYLQL